jgi:arylsulfatase A-like enzyme
MQRSATRGALYDDARTTMFRSLRDAGYRTGQVNARRDDTWLDGGMWTDYRRILLDGVETITHTEGKKLWNADAVTDAAIEYLSSLEASAPHATWVHFFDPHAPRRKMEPFDWGDSDSDKYDTEVAFADLHVGRLLDWMRETGRLESTVVVLMSDHGEGFGEHGMVQHGNRPHDDQIHVPLMIWAPGVASARVATPVSTIDIAPTVLAYLGMPAIPEAEGVNLLAGEVPARPIFNETPRNGVDLSFFAYAVTDGSWRLIWDVYGNTTELYDLSRDPLELTNLADAEPERVAAMRATLARWLDATRSVRPMSISSADEGGE